MINKINYTELEVNSNNDFLYEGLGKCQMSMRVWVLERKRQDI